MIYLGFDNGTSANGIGVVKDTGRAALFKLPTRSELSYTKEVKWITRIVFTKLCKLLRRLTRLYGRNNIQVALERPMVNSMRFNASLSAVRALESTLIALEMYGISYRYIDSKEWQKEMLPSGIKGSDLLKAASFDVGKRMFPRLKIKKDADGLLIAAYLRKSNHGNITETKGVEDPGGKGTRKGRSRKAI